MSLPSSKVNGPKFGSVCSSRILSVKLTLFEPVVITLPLTIKLPTTVRLAYIVAALLTDKELTVAAPVALKVDTIAVLPPADPNVPFSGPLKELVAVYDAPVNTADAFPIVAALIVVPVNVPTTPNVLPIVAVLLTVNAETVVFPLEPTVVNNALLGVTLPIGVACRPPNALTVVTAVIDPLLVTAAAVTLPVAVTVEKLDAPPGAIDADPIKIELPEGSVILLVAASIVTLPTVSPFCTIKLLFAI
jgi:hypothetical protein